MSCSCFCVLMQGGNFAVIWLLKFCGILRKFCGLSQFCGHVLPGLIKICGQTESAKNFAVPTSKFFLVQKGQNFFISQKYIFELAKNADHSDDTLGALWKIFYWPRSVLPLYLPFWSPKTMLFIKKKHFQISEKANFAEFCGPQKSPPPDLCLLCISGE